MSKVICICGKICSGKSYYARSIREKENAVILSTDEVTYDLINNEQGEFYNIFAERVNQYLIKKAAEIVSAGVNVILEGSSWTKKVRQEKTEYFKSHNIQCEWHYIDVDDVTWQKNIAERNKRIEEGNGGADFYLDEGLMKKLESLWEEPTKEEIDVWYIPERKITYSRKSDI